MAPPHAESRKLLETPKAMATIGIVMVIGIIGILIYALSTQSNDHTYSQVSATALLIACASTLVGALLGFLFGVPKTTQRPKKDSPDDATKDGTNGIEANTNLEQISDWLTKILVGVGLTQISQATTAIEKFAAYNGPALGGGRPGEVCAVSIGILYSFCGFLVSFLWARLYLGSEMRSADASEQLAQLKEEVKQQVSDMQRQVDSDAKALNAVRRQLEPPDGNSLSVDQVQSNLNEAIIPASREVKTQIFFMAQRARRDNWREVATKPAMERTIPIFRALIASDKENAFHANHGQLGYALKDQRQPDLPTAEAELSKAIEIRGPSTVGWWLYEFNRAYCRILLDPDSKGSRPSPLALRTLILDDLKVAAQDEDLRRLIRVDPVTSAWIKLNDCKV